MKELKKPTLNKTFENPDINIFDDIVNTISDEVIKIT